MFSFQRVKQLANAALSYTLGSVYTKDLHTAVENNNLAKVKTLIDNDRIYVDLTDRSNMGFASYVNLNVTPLQLASKNGFFEIVKFLLKKGANPSLASSSLDVNMSPYFWNSLHYAVRYEHFDIAEFLVTKYEMPLDSKTRDIVKDYGVINAVEFLKKYIPNLDEKFIADVYRKHDEIEAMNWYSQQINVKNTYFDSPLRALEDSIFKGDKHLIKGLLNFNHYFKDQLNVPIYDLKEEKINDQIRKNFPEICEKFKDNSYEDLENLSNLYLENNSHKLPILFLTILKIDPAIEVIQILIDHGADVYAKVSDISALELARLVFGKDVDIKLELPEAKSESRSLFTK